MVSPYNDKLHLEVIDVFVAKLAALKADIQSVTAAAEALSPRYASLRDTMDDLTGHIDSGVERALYDLLNPEDDDETEAPSDRDTDVDYDTEREN